MISIKMKHISKLQKLTMPSSGNEKQVDVLHNSCSYLQFTPQIAFAC